MRPILACILAFCLSHDSSSAQPSNSSASRWISPYAAGATNERTPCPILRSTFTVNGPVRAASVRIVGLGHYELFLNGKRVGMSLINQPWSQYNKTIYWQEFDISKLLRNGENVWGVVLGNSFWQVGPANDSMRFVKTDAMPDFAAGYPYLLWLEAQIKTKDGNEQVARSDDSWKWLSGPLTFSHIYAGEDYDARLTPAGWNAPGFNDSSWKPVTSVQPPAALLERYTGTPSKCSSLSR
jgi:alpha-L-rhamnosidase